MLATSAFRFEPGIQDILSFRAWQALDLTVSPGCFVYPVPRVKDRFPTFVAMFGANASGKTNVMRSSQASPAKTRPSMSQFRGEGQDEEPTEFEMETMFVHVVRGRVWPCRARAAPGARRCSASSRMARSSSERPGG